jgi:hypothetical protein
MLRQRNSNIGLLSVSSERNSVAGLFGPTVTVNFNFEMPFDTTDSFNYFNGTGEESTQDS